MVGKCIFQTVSATPIFLIPAKFRCSRNELIRIICKIVYLRCFESHIIYAALLCQLFYIINLVLIWFHHKELKKNKWRTAFKLFFPCHYVFCSLNYFVKLSAFTVLLIYILRSAVY